MSYTRVISAGSLSILQSRGEPISLQNGTRKVSNSSYMSGESMDSQATVEIPDELESVKTLEFLELNTETAQIVYNNYKEFEAEYPDRADILEFAKDHVYSIAGDALLEGDDWYGVMQRIGLKSNFQARVMDPAFKHMRLNATAKETAIWMMEMRYEFLETLDSFIQAPQKGVGRKVSHMDLTGKLRYGPASEIPKRSGSKNKGQPSVGTFKAGSSSSHKSEDPQLEFPNSQYFYKGGSVSRLELLNGPDGKLAIERLMSTPPGDFDIKAGLYLTKQERVAYEYAKWARRVVDGNVVPVGILRIAIPNDLLHSTTEVVGDNWRRYVWNCRRGLLPPQDLKHLETFHWLTGPLCRQSNRQVSRLSNSSELVIWKLENGEAASRHFTSSVQMFSLLNESCVGKTLITNLAGGGAAKN